MPTTKLINFRLPDTLRLRLDAVCERLTENAQGIAQNQSEVMRTIFQLGLERLEERVHTQSKIDVGPVND